MVLFALSIVLAGLVMPLSAARDKLNRLAMREQFAQLESALIGHLLAQGRLPCAATSDSRGSEARSPSGCAAYSGFVPIVEIGLSGPVDTAGRLLDPWHRPIRYRVSASDNSSDGLADYVVVDGVVLTSPLRARADNQILHAIDEVCGGTTTRASGVVVVLVSEGEQSARSAAEQENLDDDLRFVSRPVSDAPACAFDDHLHWLSENRVLAMLLRAGLLPREHTQLSSE